MAEAAGFDEATGGAPGPRRGRGHHQRPGARLPRRHRPDGGDALRGPRRPTCASTSWTTETRSTRARSPAWTSTRYVSERRTGRPGRAPHGEDHGLRDLPAHGAAERLLPRQAEGRPAGPERAPCPNPGRLPVPAGPRPVPARGARASPAEADVGADLAARPDDHPQLGPGERGDPERRPPDRDGRAAGGAGGALRARRGRELHRAGGPRASRGGCPGFLGRRGVRRRSRGGGSGARGSDRPASTCSARSNAGTGRSPSWAWARGPGDGPYGRGGANLPAQRGRLRRHPDRERPHLRRAAAREPEALREGLPAPQPVRHQPRADREPSTRRPDPEPGHHHRDGPLRGVALRALPGCSRRARPRRTSAAGESEDARRSPTRRGRRSGRSAVRSRWRTWPGPAPRAAGARAWPSWCRWPRASASKASWRWASAPRVPRSRRRTATSPRPWPGRPWPRWRAPGCTGCSSRSSARTASCRSPARSSRACSRRLPRDRRLRGGGGEPLLLRGGRRLLRLDPARRGPAGPRRGRRLGQGNAGQHPDGLGPRLDPGAGGHGVPRRS